MRVSHETIYKYLYVLPRGELRRILTKCLRRHHTNRRTKNTRMQVYFAHPHSPWERGTNENTNSLVRQFFPKGTDFSNISNKAIKKAQDMLNDRPRKTLKFNTPHEVFNKLLSVALET